MAEDQPDTQGDDDAESDEETGQNQYGGDSGDFDAVEQTERMEEDEADGS